MTLNLLMQPGIAHPYLYECVWYIHRWFMAPMVSVLLVQ